MASKEEINISTIPGFTTEELDAHVSRLLNLEREIEAKKKEFDAALKAIKGLEGEYKTGAEGLREAIKGLDDEGKYVARTTKTLTTFTLTFKTNAPGVEQLQERFLSEVAAKFKPKIVEEINELYASCRRSLETATPTIYSLKMMDGLDGKKAGLMDSARDFANWLSGGVAAIKGLPSTIKKWVSNITRDVESAKDSANAIDDLLEAMSKQLSGASKMASVPTKKLKMTLDSFGSEATEEDLENYAEEVLEAFNDKGIRNISYILRNGGEMLEFTGSGWDKVDPDEYDSVTDDIWESGKWVSKRASTYDVFAR